MDFTLRNTVRIQGKSASYTMKADDIGTLFTNTGASGAITLTTPKFTEIWDGWVCDVFVSVDQSVTVTAGDADTVCAFNDVAADSVAFSTASKKVGGGLRCVADVTNSKWYFLPYIYNTAADGTTLNLTTVAT